jgi:hypothetical protein
MDVIASARRRIREALKSFLFIFNSFLKSPCSEVPDNSWHFTLNPKF